MTSPDTLDGSVEGSS